MKGGAALSNLHPVFRAAVDYLLEECDRLGLAPVVVEGWRSPTRQMQLYRQGRTRPGQIVTNAKAWESPHQYGLAVDITSQAGWDSPQARRINQLGRVYGFGTVQGDTPHLEFPGWRNLLK